MKPTRLPEPQKTRILVVDDHPLFREGVVQTVNHQRDWVCCGEIGKAIEALAAKTLPQDRVRFWPGQPDIRPLLHQACLLVLSSRYEALPNVVLEAMAAGLPVAATRVGGLPELVVPGRTGWLVPPGDAPALAAAMSQALGDADAREALGRTGREIAVADFSLEAMTRRYEQVLSSLLKDRRAPK